MLSLPQCQEVTRVILPSQEVIGADDMEARCDHDSMLGSQHKELEVDMLSRSTTFLAGHII